jgi:hypothetical protein
VAATSLADALRLSGLASGTGLPVRLRLPEWRNYTGQEFRNPEATVQRLCGQINRRSGAAVAFAPESAVARRLWGPRDVRLLPTRLTLERTENDRSAELVLDIVDATEATRIVQIRHPVRLSRQSDGREPVQGSYAPDPDVPEAGPLEDVRGPAVERQPAGLPAGAEARDETRIRRPRSAITIRKCRLPHPGAMPVDEDVERETELDCGRLLFLDRKTAERLVLLSAECQRQDDGTLLVGLELVCRRKRLEVEAWAEFFDHRGRGVNRTRAQEYRFREGQIRVITLSSGLPSEQVVVFIEKD